MRGLLTSVVVAVAGLLASCGEREPGTRAGTGGGTAGYSSLVEPVAESEFSPWMSKADQQVVYEGRKEGTYFAYTEGRNNGGFLQFRHVLKEFKGEEHTEWAVFWGLSEDEFYQLELGMRNKGFAREHLQVFEDSSGKAYHQVLWLLPR